MWTLLVSVAIASPWIEPTGQIRLGVAATWLQSEAQFASGEAAGLTGPLCPDPVSGGDRMPYSCVTGGRYTQASVSMGGTVGLGRGIAVDVAVPVVVAAFEDTVGRTGAAGIGDVRSTLRIGDTRGSLAGALTLQIDAPTGPGDFQDRDVPLGNGQWDLVPGVRGGWSLHPHGWIEIWQAWAFRLRNGQTRIDPGDEWRASVAAGWTPTSWGGLLVRGESLVALADRDAFGLAHPGRSLIQARLGGVVRPIPSGWVEIGVAVPLAGRRWPAATAPYASVIWTIQ